MYNIILPATKVYNYYIYIYTLLLQVELFHATYYYYMYLWKKCLLNKKKNKREIKTPWFVQKVFGAATLNIL